MRGVVLAGGLGTRLRPLTYSVNKQLIPVANRPTLFYALNDLGRAGVTEVAIIVAPETGDQVRSAVGDGSPFGIRPTYVLQEEPNGLAAALGLALPFVDGDDSVMVLGDVLAPGGIESIVDDFERHRPSCQLLVGEVPDPRAYGVVDVGPDGEIRRLVEKPPEPPSNLAIAGVYAFDDTIAEGVEAIEPSWRGEYEITDAIQYLLERGRSVLPTRTPRWWKDTGSKENLLEANHLLLSDSKGSVEGELVDCAVEGEIQMGPGSVARDCRLVGPLSIGEGVSAESCVLGPGVSIGNGCRIQDSSLEDTILMEGSTVRGWKIRSGLVGPRAELGPPAPDQFVPLLIGELSAIGDV